MVYLGRSNKQRVENMRQKWKSNYDTIHFCALKVVTETPKAEVIKGQMYNIKAKLKRG